MSAPHGPTTLLRNAFFATLSAGSAVLLLVLLLVAGRILGEIDYGKFSFALALATIFETFADFGLKQVTTRTVARDRGLAHRLVSNTVGLKLVLATVAMAGLVFAAGLLRPEADVRLACYLLGASAMLRSYVLTARHLLIGLERFELESLLVVGDRFLLLTTGLGALVFGYGLIGLAAAFVFARVATVCLAYLLSVPQIGRFRPAFDVAYWRDLQTQALPFGAFALVLYLYNYVDTVMLGVLRGDAETGYYNAAYRLYEGFSSIPGILQAVLIPRLAVHFVHARERHRRLARMGLVAATLVAVPTTAGAILAAEPIVRLVFGEAYMPSVGAFQILALGFLFVFPLFMLYAEAVSSNAEHLLLRTGVAGCTVNIALNILLIPSYGMHGAAVATLAAEFVSVVFLLGALRRRTSS